LIAQRRADHKHGLKWEFPGGKVEATETPREALERELEEELGVRAVIGEEITRYEYQYPGRPPIHLIFFWVREFSGEPVNRVFEKIRWEEPGRFREYDFLDGDVDFVRRLAEGEV
jgi:8-oxo-dGTP diphosphatase